MSDFVFCLEDDGAIATVLYLDSFLGVFSYLL